MTIEESHDEKSCCIVAEFLTGGVEEGYTMSKCQKTNA